jgi:hypothetical protein
MACTHDGFHGIHTSYDQRRALLVFFWSCERCGVRLRELHREEYRPSFDPRGSQRHVAPLR